MAALSKAGGALDKIRPYGAKDMAKAFNRDLSLINEAARGRTRRAIQAMNVEREMRQNPERRAARFISDWQRLSREHEMHHFNVDEEGIRKAEAGMTAMGRQLERDPQLESLLRTRTHELGIELDFDRSLSRTIQGLFRRSRGLGIGF